MEADDNESVRAASDLAFGQRYRLECMLAIASDLDREVSLSALAEELRLSPSQIQGAFRAMVGTGLLTPVASADHRRKIYVANAESAAWRWAKELAR